MDKLNLKKAKLTNLGHCEHDNIWVRYVICLVNEDHGSINWK